MVASPELASVPLERGRMEVVFATDVLRNRRAARALLDLLRRGGRVVVLAAPQGLRDGEGYLLSLALAGIQSEDAVTLIVTDRTTAQAARTAILRAWGTGAPP